MVLHRVHAVPPPDAKRRQALLLLLLASPDAMPLDAGGRLSKRRAGVAQRRENHGRAKEDQRLQTIVTLGVNMALEVAELRVA